MPLISNRLTARDCRPLIERITFRVESWTSKRLSYAGRLQLIGSVLFSIQVYWSSIFIFTKEVCKVIDQILRSFLWHGTVGISKAAKVAWDVVCLPREEGGLASINRIESRGEGLFLQGCAKLVMPCPTKKRASTRWYDSN